MGDSNVGGASNNDMATGTAAGPAAGTENNERTPSSVESTPEADGGAAAPAQDQAHPQKRKGGRKPVCLDTLHPCVLVEQFLRHH